MSGNIDLITPRFTPDQLSEIDNFIKSNKKDGRCLKFDIVSCYYEDRKNLDLFKNLLETNFFDDSIYENITCSGTEEYLTKNKKSVNLI
jgi:hypothetical protein